MSCMVFHWSSCDHELAFQCAARAFADGKLVVFPTETVYGIGCNALDPVAVRSLFEAKHRPLDKPLLLHLYSMEQAEEIAVLNAQARTLFSAFTPGPLSVILPKKSSVPSEVTSGGNTVGLRFPSNPLFIHMAEHVKTPIAATSANISGFSSAKNEKDLEQLIEIADVMIEDGTCAFSLESTIVSLVSERPKILRQGALSRDAIEEVIGKCD